MALGHGEKACGAEIFDGAADGTLGEADVLRYGRNCGKTLPISIGPVIEVQIYGDGPVREITFIKELQPTQAEHLLSRFGTASFEQGTCLEGG